MTEPAILSFEDLIKLRSEFPEDHLGVKVQSFSKDRTRAALILYLQHTDVQNRLEEVDPAWKFEILDEKHLPDMYVVRSRITLKGVSRENVGEGDDPKSAYSDSLKRCAMLFGVGRYLYDSETVWVEYRETEDRYYEWTIEDYRRKERQRAGNTAAAKKPDSKVTPPANPLKPQSGAFCGACGKELVLSKAGTGYYCPNFKDSSKGEHTRFPTNQLDEYKYAQEDVK